MAREFALKMLINLLVLTGQCGHPHSQSDDCNYGKHNPKGDLSHVIQHIMTSHSKSNGPTYSLSFAHTLPGYLTALPIPLLVEYHVVFS